MTEEEEHAQECDTRIKAEDEEICVKIGNALSGKQQRTQINRLRIENATLKSTSARRQKWIN